MTVYIVHMRMKRINRKQGLHNIIFKIYFSLHQLNIMFAFSQLYDSYGLLAEVEIIYIFITIIEISTSSKDFR